MKILLILLTFMCFQSGFAANNSTNDEVEYLQDNITIRDHMLMMDRERDAFFTDLNDPKVSQEKTLSHLKNLRIHFHSLFSKVPNLIKDLKQQDKAAYTQARLSYQSQMLIALNWTIEMEKTILRTVNSDQEKERREMDIRNLSHQLNLIVGKGHSKFRGY